VNDTGVKRTMDDFPSPLLSTIRAAGQGQVLQFWPDLDAAGRLKASEATLIGLVAQRGRRKGVRIRQGTYQLRSAGRSLATIA